MIELKNVCKYYEKGKKKEIILKDISFTIGDNKVIALLGPNGSGKSTLIKCICGVIKPDEGGVFIDGKNSFIYRKKIISGMGVVFNQKPSFIVDLSVNDNLQYFKAIYGIKKEEYAKNFERLNKYLDFSELLDRPYRKLSFGERVKCEIASVLLHNPKYIILDEPTIGLDYGVKKRMYNLLDELKKEGHTIVVTTHETEYIEGICDEVVILSDGVIKYYGEPEKVLDINGNIKKITVEYDEVIDEELAREIEGKDFCKKNPDGLELTYYNAREKNKIISDLTSAYDIKKLNVVDTSIREVLEDVIKKIR